MDFNNICRFCMAVDEPIYNIFEDLDVKAKADALLPNLKVRFLYPASSFRNNLNKG